MNWLSFRLPATRNSAYWFVPGFFSSRSGDPAVPPDVRYEREAELIPHYDANPEYYSPVPDVFPRLIEFLQFAPAAGQRALDLGCGDGRLSIWLAARHGMTVDGVDYSSVRIDRAVHTAEREGVPCQFVCGDLHAFLDGCRQRYDLITVFEVLEHLERPEEVIARCRERLAPEGSVVGSVPINMPYKAHLQVFQTIEDVIRRLAPQGIVKDQRHWYCRWSPAETPPPASAE